MIVKLLTEHHLEFLSLKGGCRGSSESTLVKMSNCWKSHATAHLAFYDNAHRTNLYDLDPNVSHKTTVAYSNEQVAQWATIAHLGACIMVGDTCLMLNSKSL